MAIRIDLVLVRNLPRPTGVSVKVGHGFGRGRVLGPLRRKGVAVLVLRRSDGRGRGPGIDLEDCVVRSVDVGVDAQAEEMLMVVRVDAGIHLGAPALGILTGIHGVGVEDAGELDLELDGAVLVEDPVDAVFVVGRREDVRDDELARPRHDDRVVAEVGVLEEDARVFLVDADGVLDRRAGPGAVDEGGVQVVDRALAVAAEGEAVGHVAPAILSEVEGVLALMGMLGVAIRHHHFRQREAVKGASLVALVIVGDVAQDDALFVVEADVNLPVLPLHYPSIHFEGYPLWLSNVDWLQIFAISALRLDGGWCVVVWWRLA